MSKKTPHPFKINPIITTPVLSKPTFQNHYKYIGNSTFKYKEEEEEEKTYLPQITSKETEKKGNFSKLHYIGSRIYKNDTFKPLQKRTIHTTTNSTNNSNKKMLIEYQKDEKKKDIGILLETKQNSMKILTKEGEELIENEQISFKYPFNEEMNYELLIEISKNTKELENVISQEKVENLWRKQLNNRKSILLTCQEASKFLFESINPCSIYTSFRILTYYKEYFEMSNSYEFECRSIRQVEEMKKYLKDKTSKLQLYKLIQLLLENSKEKEKYKLIEKEMMKYFNEKNLNLEEIELNDLKMYALNLLPNHSKIIYEKYLKPLSFQESIQSAYQLCLESKLFFTKDIHLLKTNLELEFNKNIEREIEELNLNHDPDSNIRRDLRYLNSYAIDDSSTLDVDDAISIDESFNLYIHISDVTKYLSFHNNIIKNAFSRSSSIYLPNYKIPMFPKLLSEDILSLSSKRENYCLTFKCKLNQDQEIIEYEIFPSLLNPIIRYSYKDLNILEKKEFQLLNDLCKKRLEKRLKNGAIESNLPTFDIKVFNENEIQLELNQNNELKRIVQEMMIIGNEIASKFTFENSIEIPYKITIGEKKEIEFIENHEYSYLLNEYQKQKLFHSTCYSPIPSFHYGIGLSSYTQVTSPIRRGIDLLIHYQIKNYLRREKLLNWKEIQELLNEMDPKLKLIQNLQKNSERFWIYKYFEMNYDKIYKTIILEYSEIFNYSLNEYKMMIYLLDLGFKYKIILNRYLNQGDIIYLKCSFVNPLENILEFKEIN